MSEQLLAEIDALKAEIAKYKAAWEELPDSFVDFDIPIKPQGHNKIDIARRHGLKEKNPCPVGACQMCWDEGYLSEVSRGECQRCVEKMENWLAEQEEPNEL